MKEVGLLVLSSRCLLSYLGYPLKEQEDTVSYKEIEEEKYKYQAVTRMETMEENSYIKVHVKKKVPQGNNMKSIALWRRK